MKNFRATRLAGMPTSIFSTMSKMAVDYKAVNLGQGFPDFDGPPWIMEKAFQAMEEGKNQYAPTVGIYSLKKNIAKTIKKYYDIDRDPDTEITITAGATEALYSTITAFINPGDEVILFEPYYDSHQADVILAGGIPRYVTLHKPDFTIDPDELRNAVSAKTKMIILNTPHNPTGKILSAGELQLIADIANEFDLLVLSDEVYEFMLFDGNKHNPIAKLPGMKDRTITISSTGKTFGMTGWKIGYAICSQELTESIRKVHQWTTYAVNTPGQHAMAYAFSMIDEYLPEFRSTYSRKRDLLYNALKDTDLKPHLPQGTYFLMIDLPDGRFKNDIEAASYLVKEHGVATIPPSVFYSESDEGKTMLRLCFAKKDETLKAGIEKLLGAL